MLFSHTLIKKRHTEHTFYVGKNIQKYTKNPTIYLNQLAWSQFSLKTTEQLYSFHLQFRCCSLSNSKWIWVYFVSYDLLKITYALSIKLIMPCKYRTVICIIQATVAALLIGDKNKNYSFNTSHLTRLHWLCVKASASMGCCKTKCVHRYQVCTESLNYRELGWCGGMMIPIRIERCRFDSCMSKMVFQINAYSVTATISLADLDGIGLPVLSTP